LAFFIIIGNVFGGCLFCHCSLLWQQFEANGLLQGWDLIFGFGEFDPG